MQCIGGGWGVGGWEWAESQAVHEDWVQAMEMVCYQGDGKGGAMTVYGEAAMFVHVCGCKAQYEVEENGVTNC